MRKPLIISVIIMLIAAGTILLTGYLSTNSLASFTIPPQMSNATSNAIVRENAYPGSISWKIPQGKVATTQIQAYASATSAAPGQTLTFYVSTQVEGTPYFVDIYRLGWYQGDGGRQMAASGTQTGHAQGYYDAATHKLHNCASCQVNYKTGLVEANWHPSYTLLVPNNWTTGIYLAKFTDESGQQTYTPFDVTGPDHSAYIIVTPDTTYEAYNPWGGYSLYSTDNPAQMTETVSTTAPRGVKVSFDRPYTPDQGASQILLYEANAIHWLEQQGYDLSYISNVDLQDNPAQLLQHKAYISLGHDEYWTKEMRDGIEAARNRGVGLAFLGANAGYWQMRFEADSARRPNRTIVCYKVSTLSHNLASDPLYGKDNKRVTARWRDPLLGRPENALEGVMFSDLTHHQLGFPWQVSPQAPSSLLNGTGLQSGKQYGCDLVGYEWDRIFNNGASPPHLHSLSASSTTNDDNLPDTSNTTYYIASSGALVFATGSLSWTSVLDNYRFSPDSNCTPSGLVVPGVQYLLANVMNALVIHHPQTGL